MLEITFEKKDGTKVIRTIKPEEFREEKHVDDYGYLKTVLYLYAKDETHTLLPNQKHIKRWICNKFIRVVLV